MIDLDVVRSDTPSCADQVFLDSAGSSLPPRQVLDEVIGHLRREAEVGGYRAAIERLDDLEDGYRVAAGFLGCEAFEVAFTDSATRSWNLVFAALPLAQGDRILVSEVEYASNAVALLHRTAAVGASVEPIPSDETGAVDPAALRELLDERVRLVSLVHVPTNGGLVNPVREITDAAHEVGAFVLLDACQSAGQLRVRADELGVDALAVTGRKWLRGPRGTGVLVVRRPATERLRPGLVDLHGATWMAPDEIRLRDDARVYELWEFGVAERLGLLQALRYADALGVDEIAAAVADRAQRARDGLATVPGVTVHDLGRQRCGIVSFTVDGVPAEKVRDLLRERDITVTVSRVHSTLLDMTRRGLPELVRASPHYFVSPEQIDEFVAEVAALR
ncbi:aminotransferase class V [Longimycelium tulufanense]|uniref:Probable hercynylcysteine sulfoxide lyase n=1 Tax=Longimycelium tulufanense TaxID=907463 RepID=A0A8J3FSF2_9PSEU|nr:aminotransferase class V-fold PLP-dependent enzyme [Longimycelium tulufanense]GGM37526.1 aminotransferase class V [Longimycelium tulufanense]